MRATEPAPLARLEFAAFDVALRRDWRSAHGQRARRRGWLLRLVDAGGGCGWGECGPLAEAGTERPEEAREALEDAAGRWPGLEPAEAFASLPGHDRPAARCALDSALCDLAARRAGQPLHRWLSATSPATARVNAFLGGVDAGLPGRVAAALAEGYRVLKVKLSLAPLEEELAALEALALPAGAFLRLDANGGWDEREARAALKRLAALSVESLEEPLAGPDPRTLAALQATAAFPLALDESLARFATPLPVRRQVLKPMVAGGPRALLARARRGGVETVLTGTVDTAIGLWHAAQLAAALESPLAHGLATGDWLSDTLGPALPIDAGVLHLPAAAGLGFDPAQVHSIQQLMSST